MVLLAAAVPAPPPRGSSALWDVVHDLCVPDRGLFGAPAPCLAVDRRQGWAVVADPRNRTHLLLVPTRRLSGIESPELLSPTARNYWADAWRARRYLERRAGGSMPRQAIVLVINSTYGRTQNQLHIHIDCVQPEVARRLADEGGAIGTGWAPLGAPLQGVAFEARRLEGPEIDQNPFVLLAEDPSARADMGLWTLAAVGAVLPDGRPGFYLLAHRAHPELGDLGSGEILLDHGCAVLHAPI